MKALKTNFENASGIKIEHWTAHALNINMETGKGFATFKGFVSKQHKADGKMQVMGKTLPVDINTIKADKSNDYSKSLLELLAADKLFKDSKTEIIEA